ncbi:DDE superfamily endonuclease domain-containing protein [Phthorimaea operculella]|nr:DDE superfamily endonuclease domain-containing protein [Phthorimaea operculella]
MENFEVFDFVNEVDAFFDEVGALGELGLNDIIPRQHNIYLRNIKNPFQFYSDQEFRDRFRFYKETVRDHVMPLISFDRSSQWLRGLPIPAETQMAAALRYYATGSFQAVCGDLEFISQPSVSRIIKNISAQLAAQAPSKLVFPENLTNVSTGFEYVQTRYPGLKNIIGAIDCTHIKINRPRGINHSEVYRNRKGYFSINAQAVVGQDMKIYDLVVRWPGSTHDSRIFRNSRLHSRLQNRQLEGILVGDSGYRATNFMLTPFNQLQTRAQNKYNYVQIRTRNVVERTFGAIKKQFECLRRGIGTKLTTATNVILSCAVLHNIARDANEPLYEDPDYREDGVAPVVMHSASGLAFRQSVVENYYT